MLRAHPGVHVNCDAISTIRRLGARCPGRTIGVRLNPGIGAGYNERLRYAGEKATKFGVYPDRVDEAFAPPGGGHDVDTLHSTSAAVSGATHSKAGKPAGVARSSMRSGIRP